MAQSESLLEYALSKLYPNQREALERMHDGCVLLARPGAGKTITALSYWLRAHAQQRLVIVTTPAKRDSMEWVGDAAKIAVVFPEDAIVTSWNKIRGLEKIEGAFFIFDEQKASGSGKWATSFVKIARKNDWIMLSATPGDVWMDWVPLFMANSFYRTRTEFYDNHVIWDPYSRYPRVKRYFGEQRLRRHRSSVCVYMEVERATERTTEDILVGYDKELYDDSTKRRWNPFKDEPVFDAGGLCHVQRRIVCQSEARLEAAKTVIERHPRVIVFYNFNLEKTALREAARGLNRAVYERNGEVHDRVPMDDGPWVYLVQYLAADAWNCISTNVSLFYSLPYSWRQLEQAYGRIDRLNQTTKDLLYYRLVSDSSIDNAVLAALDRKESFNMKTYATSQGFADIRKEPK